MSTHKHFDKICCVVLALTLIITVLFINGDKLGIQKASSVMKYETALFDDSKVHTIDIVMDNWDEFTENCKSEEYYDCTVVIDNEAFKNVAIRGKGNTSLSSVTNDRYSYKIEFDHYDNTNTYHGLDKLCLNNIIQDNTYMKDYLTYQMMNDIGVASPLCSFVYITVNGEDWGLYLAVEGVEDSFLQRNYGKDCGELYKPDSMSMGGGRGNGGDFNMDDFLNSSESANSDDSSNSTNKSNGNQGSFDFSQLPEGMTPPTNSGDGSFDFSQMPEGMTPPTDSENGSFDFSQTFDDKAGGFGGFGMGSSDVKLQYIDDNISSYSNIFDSAKTDITKADKTRLIESLKNLSNGENLESAVDIEAVIKYFVVHNFVVNADSYTGSMIHNYYLYEKDGQMQMIPWDYNLAFGSFMSSGDATSSVNDPIDTPLSVSGSGDRPMIDWIFSKEEYTELYHQYFNEFIAEYFNSGYFEKMIDSTIEMISPYVEKDPTKFCAYDEFLKGAETLKQFCLLRSESISGQLDGTIGSTSDTQENGTLVDASHLKTSDMGSMGGGMGRPNNNSQNETDKEIGADEETSTETTTEAVTEPSSDRIPQFDFSENGNMSQMPEGMTPPNSNGGSFDFSQMPEGMAPPNNSGFMPMSDTDTQSNGTVSVVPLAISDENSNSNNGNEFSQSNNFPQENFNGQMQRPNGNMPSENMTSQSAVSSDSLILLAVSFLFLILGLVFAIGFKRRK